MDKRFHMLHLKLDNSATRNVIEAVGPWIYLILLLLVAAVLVAVGLSVAARRTLVRLVSDARELPVPPGGRVSFPFRAEGLAREQDTLLLQVSAVQEGWAAFLPVPELVLGRTALALYGPLPMTVSVWVCEKPFGPVTVKTMVLSSPSGR